MLGGSVPSPLKIEHGADTSRACWLLTNRTMHRVTDNLRTIEKAQRAFPIRKRHQRKHLDFVLLWLRTRISGVQRFPNVSQNKRLARTIGVRARILCRSCIAILGATLGATKRGKMAPFFCKRHQTRHLDFPTHPLLTEGLLVRI